MNINEKLYNIRKDLGYTLEEMADKLSKFSDSKISKSAVNRWENGISMPNATYVALYGKAFGIDLNYLFDLKDGNPLMTKSSPTQTYILNPTLASAGSSSYNDGYSEALEIEVPDALLGKYAGRKDLQFIKVTGESMNNVIKPDSIVAYTTEPSLTNLNGGDIVLYRYQSEQGIKRFYDIGDSVLFRPDSNMSGFKEQRFLKDEYLEIIGKVVIYSVFM